MTRIANFMTGDSPSENDVDTTEVCAKIAMALNRMQNLFARSFFGEKFLAPFLVIATLAPKRFASSLRGLMFFAGRPSWMAPFNMTNFNFKGLRYGLSQ